MLDGLVLTNPGPAVRPNSFSITPYSLEAIGPSLAYHGMISSSASATWPSANYGIFYPFKLQQPATLYQFYVSNGATASGNLDIGLYLDDGSAVVRRGSTAQAGTSAVQLLDVTDTLLSPGVRYWVGLAMDGTLGTCLRQTGNTNVGQLRACGVRGMASAFSSGLVATVTFAALNQNFLPHFGAVLQSDF